MDILSIDWHLVGTFCGGLGASTLLQLSGAKKRMDQMSARIDVQAENHTNLVSELNLTRTKLAKTSEELERVTKMLLRERRLKRALANRVTVLEAQLREERDQLVRLRFEYAESLALKEPSHDTLPPPGGKPR